MPANPPEGYHTVTPQLMVEDAADTIEFVEKVFGAQKLSIYESGGVINHAEVMIGDSRVMVASASQEFPSFPGMLVVYVDDVDATYQRALEHGASSLREPKDEFYGDRTGGVLDSHGNQWWIATHIEDVSEEELRRRIQSAQTDF